MNRLFKFIILLLGKHHGWKQSLQYRMERVRVRYARLYALEAVLVVTVPPQTPVPVHPVWFRVYTTAACHFVRANV